VTRDYAGSEVAPDARFGAAVAALRRGNADAAARRLRALADEAPANLHRPQALLLLARLDLDAKRYDAARRGFEDLLDGPGAADAGAQTRRQAETGLIDTLLALGEDDAAASRLTALLSGLPAGDPQRYRAQLTLGHCRYRQKAYEAALSAYREAARSPDTSVAAEGDYWAGNAALALNRPADAAARFQQVVARSPQSAIAPRAALKAAEARTAAKQHREAAAAYRAVVQKYPGSKEADAAQAALAGLLDAVNDPAALAAAVNGAAATPEEQIRGRLRLARLHVAAKRYPAAVTLLEAALRGTPRPAGARAAEANYLLGLAREGQGKAAPAAAAFSAAVEKAPPSAPWLDDARSRMAWLYLDLKQPARAQAAAEAVLARRGSAADTAGGEDVTAAASVSQARLALLQAYLDQKRWDAALGVCDALTAAADPAPETEATVLFTRAWVREQQGRPDEARALWERLAAEHGRSRYAAQALVRLGDADLKAKRYDAARERYAAAVTDHPQSPLRAEARFKLGSALYHLDRFPEAAREFDGVVATAGANDYLPEALYWAGLALDKAGDKRGAIERLSRLVRRFPKHGRVAGARVRLAALKAVA
jgi:TolA-binding protein